MTYYVNRKEVSPEKSVGHTVYNLLDETNGCSTGTSTGVSVYAMTEFSKPGLHEDQEGFYVIEGTGWAKVGDEEFRIEPEGSFIVPAQTPHSLRRDPDSKPLKVFWFHAPV
jgi:mannose-6-phosphate isomerase-like protein (cupin superfamily)